MALVALMLALTTSLPATARQAFAKRSSVQTKAVNQSGKIVTAAEEDFSKFTNGSEEAPAADTLALDWYGNFDESKLNTPGWGGRKVHEAGGCAFVEKEGYVTTPNLNLTDLVDNHMYVSFRARLAAGATTGKAYVRMGYSDPQPVGDLTADWKEYKLESTEEFSGTYLTLTASDDWYVDDIKVEKTVPFVSAPEALTFADYKGNGFTAIWQPVEGAAYYLVNIYGVDAEENMTPVKSNERAYECRYVAKDLPEIDGLYCFTVTTVDADRKRSEPSYAMLVEALLTPETYDAIDVTADGFIAQWEEVDRALAYDVYVYRETSAAQAAEIDIVNTDFGFVKADDNSEMESVSYEKFPGWVINVPLYEDGAIGMDGARAPIMTSMFASMESPVYDLSNGAGSITVTVSARSTRGATLTFSLFTMKDGAYPIYPESYVALTDLPFETYETRSFTLTGGGANSVIYVETADWGQTWITDLKITQKVYAGQTVRVPVADVVTDGSSAEFRGLNLADGSKYYFTLRAMGLSLDESYYIGSDFTAPHYVEFSQSGIEDAAIGASSVALADGELTIVNPSCEAVSISDLSGRLLVNEMRGQENSRFSLENKGVYIIKVGGKTFKLIY